MNDSNFFYSPNCEIKSGMRLPDGVKRYVLIVEYCGTRYQGFQRQSSTKNTIQAELEKNLSAIAARPITLVCAGRTDAGVHATGQVVHFDSDASRDLSAWVDGTNTKLPDDIRIRHAQEVSGEFHARFSAQARTYRYITYVGKVRSAFIPWNVTWYRSDFDLAAMQRAAQYLIGEHNFTSFRASQCQSRSPVRRIDDIRLWRSGPFIKMEIKANAFLHHMVRNIMGCLYEVGRGLREPDWLASLLKQQDRNMAAATAPPHGLYLIKVDYVSGFGLPTQFNGLGFIGDGDA